MMMAATPMHRSEDALQLNVRLLPEPSLWCWEIVDPARPGAIVESSWADEWRAYDSPEEATSAGCVRLQHFRSTRASAAGDQGDKREEQ
jgi:hypothetical protein